MKKMEKDEQAVVCGGTLESPHDNSFVLRRVKSTEWKLKLPRCVVDWFERRRMSASKARGDAHVCHNPQE